jgi:glutamate racemase
MKQPIGVFDSGLGGLTVVRHLHRILPDEDIVYFGDTARVPYGSKSRDAIVRFSRENCRFLVEHSVSMIVVACNTSSAIALDALRREHRIRIHDVIAPGARKAVSLTRSGKIGVIGTHATIGSGAYEREIYGLSTNVRVYCKPCPLFVPLAEEGWLDRPATVEIAREYLLPLKKEGIDVLILGCTHYPVLRKTIRLVMGDRVSIVDSGRCCAETVRDEMALQNRPTRSGPARRRLGVVGRLKYFVSDMPERFKEIGRLFTKEEIDEVTVVSPEELGQ